jgi:TolA-binding protein
MHSHGWLTPHDEEIPQSSAIPIPDYRFQSIQARIKTSARSDITRGRHMNRSLALLAISFLSLTACENFLTRADVREAEQKKQMQDTVVHLQKNTADTNNRFSDIEADLRNLNGRLEVVENRVSQNSQDRDKQKANLEQTNAENAKKVQVLQEEVSKLSEQVGALTAEMAAVKAAAHEAAVAPPAAKKDLFEQGDENFDKKDWKKAILNYQKFRDANPKSKKFPEATYKIAVSFQELGMKDEARTFLDELVAKYPGSPEAKKARARLKSLKK